MPDKASLPRHSTPDPEEDTATQVSWIDKLGPGLTTGAADDDPSGIATYSQAGAQFGFDLLWTTFLTYPLMVGIQVVSARIGRVSGRGLASNIRLHHSKWLLYSIVSLLVVANTINIAADVSAMGQAAQLLMGGSVQLFAAALGLTCLILQVFVPYKRYAHMLKWLTLVLLAYVATAFAVDTPWIQVAKHSVAPHLSWSPKYFTILVALFGTTISPYLFFWQASQEVEEQRATPHMLPLIDAPKNADFHLRRIKVDTFIGMGFSNLIAFFVMLTGAVVFHAHGMSNIQTSSQAALALKPIAGKFAFLIFSLGIVGTGLLAVPVLAGASAYAMAGAFQWDNSLDHSPRRAKAFYGVIGISTILGTAICFTSLDPYKALYWSAVINGVISVPIMAVMMSMASKRAIMGKFVISRRLKWLGWVATAAMALAVAFMLATIGQS